VAVRGKQSEMGIGLLTHHRHHGFDTHASSIAKYKNKNKNWSGKHNVTHRNSRKREKKHDRAYFSAPRQCRANPKNSLGRAGHDDDAFRSGTPHQFTAAPPSLIWGSGDPCKPQPTLWKDRKSATGHEPRSGPPGKHAEHHTAPGQCLSSPSTRIAVQTPTTMGVEVIFIPVH